MKRCNWKNLINNKTYQNYHDNEWGTASKNDEHLFEMFLLESFHCGLSWLIILTKREAFREAFDNFDPNIIKNYSDNKVEELLQNKEIVRNKAKILASIANAKAFVKVQNEFGSFSNYIWSFTNNEVLYFPSDKYNFTTNELSLKVSKDLKKRGFKFMGNVTCFSYLEAIGVMNNHSTTCFRYKKTTV